MVRDMSQPEQLRCNICATKVSSIDAKSHASTPSHSSLKHRLEKELEAVRNGSYANDRSVILQWKQSV
jgi:hypothetical protein